MAEIVERDFERQVSPGLLEALDGASRCTTTITLDHEAAADIYGTLTRNDAAIEQRDQIIAGLLEAIEPFANRADEPVVQEAMKVSMGLRVMWNGEIALLLPPGAFVEARAARDNARALSEAASKARAVMEGK